MPRIPATTKRSPAIAVALSADRLADTEKTALCSRVSGTLLGLALLTVETKPVIRPEKSTHASA
ncbi:hypothetical protein D3C80_1817890 [compost metagenome]